jgi:hypothetical protein
MLSIVVRLISTITSFTEIMCRDGAENGKHIQSTHFPAIEKTWKIQNGYGFKYAKACIFILVTLWKGRRLVNGTSWQSI